MNKIAVNKKILSEILEVSDKLNANDQLIHITESESNGIGTILAVEIPTTVNGISGLFTVTIRDEAWW